MSLGIATRTDDGYPITLGLDLLSGFVAPITSTLISGHETLDTNAALTVGGAAVSGSNALPILDGFQPPVSTTWTSATALNTAATVTTAGYDTVICTLVGTGTITTGAVIFEVFDGATWLPIKSARIESYFTDQGYSLIGAPATSRAWQIPVAGFPQFRVRLSTAIVGAGSMATTLILSSAPDTSIVTMGIDPSTYPIPCQPNDGTTSANVLAPGTAPAGVNALLTAGTYWAPTDFTATSTSVSPVYDIRSFKWVALQCTSNGSATTTFQVSNDPAFATFATLYLTTPSNGNQNASAASLAAVGAFSGATQGYAYFRLSTTYVSGTTTIKILFSANTATSTVLPQVTQTVVQSVSSSGGWSTFSNGALTNTPVTVKASSGALGVLTIHNPAAATTYIQIWNLLIGAVTIGTTPPFDVIPVPAGQTITVNLLPGQTFSTAISIAATTTFSGSTAPSTAAVVSFKYV